MGRTLYLKGGGGKGGPAESRGCHVVELKSMRTCSIWCPTWEIPYFYSSSKKFLFSMFILGFVLFKVVFIRVFGLFREGRNLDLIFGE